jgi:folate-binding protein YgfZ
MSEDPEMMVPAVVRFDEPVLFEFRGPDAVRYLNGQLTQDVRLVAGGKVALPSCVTDAKGRLQFRVWITEAADGGLWVEGPPGSAEALEARLTRYLIADDVEVADLTGNYRLFHLIDSAAAPPQGVFARKSRRFGVEGTDWWVPAGAECEWPAGAVHLGADELEDFRIRHGVPLWGRELTEGLLPPEAGLDASDISYQKGCYIGQEVISRIKFAGKLNKRLARVGIDPALPLEGLRLVDADGREAGEITSISPLVHDGTRAALAFIKRGVDAPIVTAPDGRSCAARLSINS